MGLSLERRSERWTISPVDLPQVRRYCPPCGGARQFVCSGRFRMNAQKKLLDVWLKYRCRDCGAVWKAPILERRPTSQLDATLREALERDDQALVWKYAFDVARRWSPAISVATDAAMRIERAAIECDCAEPAVTCLHLHVPWPCDLRLDRLLSSELQVSRTQLLR